MTSNETPPSNLDKFTNQSRRFSLVEIIKSIERDFFKTSEQDIDRHGLLTSYAYYLGNGMDIGKRSRFFLENLFGPPTLIEGPIHISVKEIKLSLTWSLSVRPNDRDIILTIVLIYPIESEINGTASLDFPVILKIYTTGE